MNTTITSMDINNIENLLKTLICNQKNEYGLYFTLFIVFLLFVTLFVKKFINRVLTRNV